ncbi:MAG: NnrU family protein [Caldimonas sp.]
MIVLVLGLIVFFGVHSVSIAAPGWRSAQIARHGERAWKGVYSIAAGIGLALLIVGYAMARREPIVLYTPPAGLRHAALLVMLPVFPLLFAAYLPGRLRRMAKHPMLLAIKLWATAHLLANGNLADVLLFGGFLAWAVVDRVSVKRRSPDEAHAVPGAPPGPMNDLIAVAGGLGVYALTVFWAHRWAFGVSPLP